MVLELLAMRPGVIASALIASVLVASAVACGSTKEAPATQGTADAGDAATIGEPYALAALDKARIGSKSEEPNFQKVTADVEPQSGPFADVKLVVNLTTTCFPFEQWKADPPPSGHNWPASCDAFDRNFEVALFDPALPDAPGLELIRAITPFGGPLHLELDVTDIFNALRGKRRLEVTIPSYSDGEGKVSGSNGGWNVSARFEVTPGAAPRPILAVLPLVYDSDTKATERVVDFSLPEGTSHARVEYLATGHGGGDGGLDCIGPAEEFCARTHTLTADGAAFVDAKKLWRTNCAKLCTLTKGGPFGEYCKENPCGAPQSVRAPRANWCPGSETAPIVAEPEAFATPGPHRLGIAVNKVADGGQWRVSAKVFAYASE